VFTQIGFFLLKRGSVSLGGKGSGKTKKIDSEKTFVGNKVVCAGCNKSKMAKEFYSSFNSVHHTGKIPYCKDCLKFMISNNNGVVSLDKLKSTLRVIDRPYLHEIWLSAVNGGGNVFGIYMKNLALPQNKYLKWSDSKFEPSGMMALNYDTFYDTSNDFELTKDLIEKWGSGYKLEEYEAFERKYKMLKDHYLEKTSMHTEALLKYIRYSVKEELATACGEPSEAKVWGQLAKDAATAAKINPSQLSASDLQDGLSTFGQLVRAVEKNKDIIPILPRFKESAQDLPDFVLYSYINYVQHLKGLPMCEYKDVYNFYEVRKKEYADRLDELTNSLNTEGDSNGEE